MSDTQNKVRSAIEEELEILKKELKTILAEVIEEAENTAQNNDTLE